MDEMKQDGEIDSVLREAAKQRDTLLRQRPTLSSARLAALADFLIAEYPIEAALGEAARKRDQLLNQHPPVIPRSVESTLRRLGAVEEADAIRRRGAFAGGGIVPSWLRFSRSRPAVVLAVSAVFMAAVLFLSGWGIWSRRIAEAQNLSRENRSGISLDRSPIMEAELFMPKVSIRSVNLNTNEPASLQASFFANRAISLADGNDGPLWLRLDLPLRASLIEDGLARTP